MAYDNVGYDVKDGVATITLNRPDAYNALNIPLARDLFDATLEADEGRDVRCIVVTGAGRAFCAGGDVKDFADNPERIGILIKELTTYLHGAVSRLARAPEAGDHGGQRRGRGGRDEPRALGRPRGRCRSRRSSRWPIRRSPRPPTARPRTSCPG